MSPTVIYHVAREMWAAFSPTPHKTIDSLKLLVRGTLIHGFRLAGSCLFGPLARNDGYTGTMSNVSHD